MKKVLIYCLGLTLAAPLCAQTKRIYSPKSLASVEGQFYCTYWGYYPDGRQMYVDGENAGAAVSITHISMRLDNRSYSSVTSPNKKWSSVSLAVCEGDFAGFSNSFTANCKTTPTTVFNTTFTLPTQSGLPATKPAVWGGTKGEYTFPFSSTWLYTGKRDIVYDFTFTGGTMVNGVTWNSTGGWVYYLDSYGGGATGTVGGTDHKSIPATRLDNTSAGVTSRCNDAAMTTATGAYCIAGATVYGSQYPIINYQNMLRFFSYSYGAGYENPVIHAVAFKTNVAGLNLQTGCNKLHVKGPMLLIPLKTFPKWINANGYTGQFFIDAPWQAAFGSTLMIVQAAWADSVTGRFALSQAHQFNLPLTAPQQLPRRSYTFHYNKASSTGFGPFREYFYSPALALIHK